MKALQHYHEPDKIQGIIRSYFDNISRRFTVGRLTTEWQRLERGITTGCTISVILFVMGMNMMISTAEQEKKGPKTSTETRLPANRGFIDDITIT